MDDEQKAFLEQVRHRGHELIAQAMWNLLFTRLEEEMFWWERRLAWEAYRLNLRNKAKSAEK